MKITACMIVKDEVMTLPDCFRTVLGFVDELVIVDTGSTDGTPYLIDAWERHMAQGTKIVRGYFKWCDDFSAARNYAMSLATGDWIFTVDADDRVAVADWPVMKRFLSDPKDLLGEFDFVTCRIFNVYGNGTVRSDLLQPRFFRRSSNPQYKGAWHNRIDFPTLDRAPNAAKSEMRIFHTGYGMITTEKLHEKNARILRMGLQYTEEHPEEAYGWRNLANAYKSLAAMGDESVYPKIIESCEKAMTYATSKQSHIFAEAVCLKGYTLYSMKELVDAEKCAAAALAEKPHFLDAILLRGYCNADMRNLPAAKYWLHRYLIVQERLSHEDRYDFVAMDKTNAVSRVYQTLAAIAEIEDRERFNLKVAMQGTA